MSRASRARHQEKYGSVVTPSMEVFNDKAMVNERPEGMSFEEYKLIRKIQTRLIKRLH